MLDAKYGDIGRIVESVIGEVKYHKRLNSDDSAALIKFVDIIEAGYRDLKKLGLQSELDNANVISIIENKLPKDIGLEWYREIHTKGAGIEMSN